MTGIYASAKVPLSLDMSVKLAAQSNAMLKVALYCLFLRGL